MNHSKCNDKDCENYGKYCRKHITPVVKEPRKIKKESKKKATVTRKQYTPQRELFLLDRPICEVEGCSNKSEHVHHKAGKDSVEAFLDESKWMAVCFPCHRKIHDNHNWAVQMGYIESRHSNFKRSA